MFYNCNEEVKRQKEQTSETKTGKLTGTGSGAGAGIGVEA